MSLFVTYIIHDEGSKSSIFKVLGIWKTEADAQLSLKSYWFHHYGDGERYWDIFCEKGWEILWKKMGKDTSLYESVYSKVFSSRNLDTFISNLAPVFFPTSEVPLPPGVRMGYQRSTLNDISVN